MMPTRPLALFPLLLAAWVLLPMLGCTRTVERETLEPRYESLGLRDVPPALDGTVLAMADLGGTNDLQVSGYGLVVNLDGTGDSTAPLEVREYILKEMLRNGIGQQTGPMPGVRREEMLEDPRVAIVRVDGLIPPGARRGDRFDVQVSALPGNETSSLAGGQLWMTRLRRADRVSQFNPGELVNVLAMARGPIFVNPANAFSADQADSASARVTLRNGLILNGGLCDTQRRLVLRIREPSLRAARYLQQRINRQFQNTGVAAAQDEGVVLLNVPEKFGDDWEHFAGVVLHLYPYTSEGFAVEQSRLLAEAARQPGAPLQNISYALEGLGSAALPVYAPLITDPDPDVAFAAARAAAFVGDPAAQTALARMSADEAHPRRVEAVRTLGKLRRTPNLARTLIALANDGDPIVRIAAYESLGTRADTPIARTTVGEKFLIDRIPGDADPLVYATTRGVPRVAVLGRQPRVDLPIVWGSANNRVTLATDPDRKDRLLVYDRGLRARRPVRVRSGPDLPQLVALLGGAQTGGDRFDLTYAEILSVLDGLAAEGHLIGPTGEQVAVELEELPGLENLIESAPRIPSARPEVADSATGGDTSDTLAGPRSDPAAAVVPDFDAPPTPLGFDDTVDVPEFDAPDPYETGLPDFEVPEFNVPD